jgi:hypothetical protein
MATDLATRDEDNIEEELGITDRQIAAIDKLDQLGAAPRASEDEPYSKDPKVRALQLVAEGKIGGPNRGQGRKRKPRAAEAVAEHVRNHLVPQIKDALEDALNSDSNKDKLQAVGMAMDIERQEDKLKLQEESADIENETREELIASLIELAEDPSIKAAIEGSVPGEVVSEETQLITDAEVITDDREAEDLERAASATDSASDGHHSRSARSNGSGPATGNRGKGKNPWTEAAERRASQR